MNIVKGLLKKIGVVGSMSYQIIDICSASVLRRLNSKGQQTGTVKH